MNLKPYHYVPCLRWKQGEYQALLRLSSEAKNSLIPLIEIPEVGFDFETHTESRSIDEHLSKFAKRVREKWGKRPCLVDTHLVESSIYMANGQHLIAFVFDDLRSKGIAAIPVIHLDQDNTYQSAIKEVVSKDKRGLCIRIDIEQSTKSNFEICVAKLIEYYSVEIDKYDFVLDLKAPNFEPIDGFCKLLEKIIEKLPHLNDWRSFILIGTSFPSSMTEVRQGLSVIKRNEWILYKSLIKSMKSSRIRIPSFGDYGINHPNVMQIDMRLAKPSASIRYTIEDGWLIAKGPNVRDHGFAQYQQLCQKVVQSEHYEGPKFSNGDQYIFNCEKNAASTGNLTTWRQIGTNHHLEKVVRDIANLFGS